MVYKGDVFSVSVPFSGLSIGAVGVCIDVEPQKNNVHRMTILMKNKRSVTLTGRETYIFFQKIGTTIVDGLTNEELIKALDPFR